MEQKRMLGSSWNDQMEVFELCECCNLNIAIYSAQRTSRSSQLSLPLIMDHGQVSLSDMGRVGGTHAPLIGCLVVQRLQKARCYNFLHLGV